MERRFICLLLRRQLGCAVVTLIQLQGAGSDRERNPGQPAGRQHNPELRGSEHIVTQRLELGTVYSVPAVFCTVKKIRAFRTCWRCFGTASDASVPGVSAQGCCEPPRPLLSKAGSSRDWCGIFTC